MNQQAAEIYASLPEFQFLLRRTRAFIADALSKVERPYLACSFGKDSSVMLDLVLEQKPDIPVKFLSKIETDLIDDYPAVIRWWEEKKGARIERICYKGWLEGATKTGIANNMQADGFDSFFVGIRKEESKGRRITLSEKVGGMFYHLKAEDRYRIAPLAHWKTKDVAAYMLTRELPVLQAYQREGFEARTTSNIPSKYPQEALTRLRNTNLEAFNKLLELLPEAKHFI